MTQAVEDAISVPAPRSLGYSMPAEWAPHEGTWFSWPHNPETWIHHLEAAERELAQAVRWLCEGETVHINVLDESHQDRVAGILNKEGVRGAITYHLIPTNDSWCRDHGPIFLTRPGDGRHAAIDWQYNAWGGKYPPYDLDNAAPQQMCEAMKARRFVSPFILEGGSIEVNGEGVLMTTETCLLNPNRNPGFSKHNVEHILREMLGVDHFLWLQGELVGDDTDGHIDNLARFVNPTTIVVPEESNMQDPNYLSLRKNLELVSAFRTPSGDPYTMVKLPMPAPYSIDGCRLPANYINFYIGNEVVLMPSFGDPNDEIAREILQSFFPNRKVVPLSCRSIIWGLGAIHCLSQQVPLPYKPLASNNAKK